MPSSSRPVASVFRMDVFFVLSFLSCRLNPPFDAPKRPLMRLPDFVSSIVRRRTRWVGMAFALVAVALLARWAVGRSVDAARVERRDVVETLVVNGRVLAQSRSDLGATVSGTVRSVDVEEGDRVAEGEVLVRLDDTEARAALREAEARVSQADARLALLRGTTEQENAEAVASAKAVVEEADAQYRRRSALHDEGVVSAEEVDSARRARDVARTALASAEARAKSTATGGSEARIARASLDEARAARASAAERLAKMDVRAPAPGVVVAKLVEPGEAVQPGKAVLSVILDRETRLIAQPDEKALASVHVGQRAKASADAYPDRSFDASVSYVSPAVDLQRGTFDVKFDVPDPPDYLKADMTLSIEIVTGERKNALVVATEAIRDLATDPWVLVIRGRRATRTAIVLGVRGDSASEVTSGLAEGDVVVVDIRVRAGDRVRPTYEEK